MLEANQKIIDNAFTKEERAKGFINMDGYFNRILTEPFIKEIKNYIDFFKVKTILEIGSRDGCQARELAKYFPHAQVYTFEPLPSNLSWVYKNTDDLDNVEVIPCAVSDINGTVNFYEVYNGNVGASSLLKVNDHPRSRQWLQRPIEVESIRMDTWLEKKSIDHIDILWADVQGAEKLVFESFGKYLNNIDCISTEIEVQRLYENAILKNDLDNILHQYECINYEIESSNTEADTIYINKGILS